MNGNQMKIWIVGLFMMYHFCIGHFLSDYEKNRIKTFAENPRYRQYEGEPNLLNFIDYPEDFVIRRLNITTGSWESIGDWEHELPLKGGDNVKICTPMRGGWIAVIFKQ